MREFPASPIAALIDEAPLYNLAESYGSDLSVAELLGPDGPALLASIKLGYRTSLGDPGLRVLVAGRVGVPPDQVLMTAGAAAALFLVGLLLGDGREGGGEVLVGRPCFPPVLDVLRGTGARVVTVTSGFEDGYRLDLAQLRARLSPRTRLVTLASPQNPSGIALSGGEVRAVLDAMSEACPGAVLLIDETYREARYGDEEAAPSFAGMSPRVLTCASLSKAYGAAGLRAGWLTVPGPALREQLRLAKFNSSVCCGAVDEFLAGRLLARADEILGQRAVVLAQARAIVEDWAAAQGGRLDWLRPDAGALGCVRLGPAADPARFHARLAELGTAVAPGPWFGDSDRVIRLGPAYEPPARLEKGLAAITAALES
jgi:aspartate/methionine/tyrosine aminotransferase